MSYKPPFKTTNNILLLIQDISKSLGLFSGAKLKLQLTKLRKSNKIKTIEPEKADYSEVLKDAFSEAKSLGFDVKIIKHDLKLCKKDKEQLAEEDNLIELYRDGGLDVQAFLVFAWYYFSNLYMISDNLTEFTKKA